MAKASERLALSQPAISKAISDMEHTLSAPLLDRSSRGVELTECGRLLVERARVIFDEVRQGVSDIEHLSDPTRGDVRIGTIEPVTGVVSEIISQLARRYFRLSYHVMVSDLDTLLRELRERNAGCADNALDPAAYRRRSGGSSAVQVDACRDGGTSDIRSSSERS